MQTLVRNNGSKDKLIMRLLLIAKINKKLLLIPVIAAFCFMVSAENKWASTAINVRTGPGVRYDIMGHLYRNEKVEVFSTVNGWAQILFENIEAYVWEELLLPEPIKTPEEEEAARIAAELEAAKQKKERLVSQIIHSVIIIIGIIGTVFIIFFT